MSTFPWNRPFDKKSLEIRGKTKIDNIAIFRCSTGSSPLFCCQKTFYRKDHFCWKRSLNSNLKRQRQLTILSVFVASCFPLTSTMLVCFKVEVSAGCSRCLALFAWDSKAFTPWPETDIVFEQTRHLAQCTFPSIFYNQVLSSLFAK